MSQASHIISRVNQLLRRIKEVAQQSVGGGAKAAGGKAIGGKSRDAERVGGAGLRKPGSRDSHPVMAGGGRGSVYTPKMDMLHVRPTLKDLRKLQDTTDLPPKETLTKTKQYLSIIGAHIDKVVRASAGSESSRDRLERRLWDYVADYSNLTLDGKRISGIYAKLKEKAAARAAAGAATAGGSGGAAGGLTRSV